MARKLTLSLHFLKKSFIFRGFWPDVRGQRYKNFFRLFQCIIELLPVLNGTMEFNQKLILARKSTLSLAFLQKLFIFRDFWPEIRGQRYGKIFSACPNVSQSYRQSSRNNGIQSKTYLSSKIDLEPPFSLKTLHFLAFLARNTRLEVRKNISRWS